MRYHILYISVIIVLLVYLIFGHNGLIQYQEMLNIKQNYELQAEQLQQKANDLEQELQLLKKDRDYYEMVIKKELNLKKPNEDLYIIDNESTQRISDNSKN